MNIERLGSFGPLAAGETSSYIGPIELEAVGFTGDFTLEVVTPAGESCTITHRVALEEETPGEVPEEDALLVTHAGGHGVYTVFVVRSRRVWLYVTAGSSGITSGRIARGIA